MSKYNGYRGNALVASGWTHEQVEASRDKSAYRGIYWQLAEGEKEQVSVPEWVTTAIGQTETAETMGEPTPKKGKAKAEQEGN